MGQEEPNGQEEGLLRVCVELLDAPAGHFPITFVFVVVREDAPIDQRMLGGGVDQFLFRPRPDTCGRAKFVELVVLLPPTVAAVVDLPCRIGAVSMLREVLRQRDDITKRLDVPEPGRKTVDTSRRWTQSRHQTCSAGIAQRRLAMGVCE